MEPKQSQPKNHWKAIAIILIIVAVALAGTTMFFAVKSVKSAEKSQNATTENPDAEIPDNAPATNKDDYLVVNEWNIRFKKPIGFTELSYSVNGNRLDFSGYFDGEPVTALHPLSSLQFNSAINDFNYVQRYAKDNDPCEGLTAGCDSLRVNLGDYIYAFITPQQSPFSQEEEYLGTISTFLLGYMFSQIEII